jgi:glyoxylase-like metal-dependent hydrolase (beta-lactamase superfamily II)/ferredoxin
MATLTNRLPGNVEGDFYVDSSCIDCGACMWIAPATFDEKDGLSFVHRQPRNAAEIELAELALVACPTASIGAVSKHDLARAAAAYPRPFADEVHHCGFHDESTFGATSWLIRRPAERGGNVLVDVPRFSEPLLERIEALGGAKLLFLTHRDDVGSHEKFAARLHCERVMHRADVTADTRTIERPLDGLDPVALDDDLLVIPTPGHTAGSACLLHREKFLFGGDHVAWNDRLGHPYAFRDACWFSWDVLKESMRRLASFRFEWILPGHGDPGRLPADEMKDAMRRCIEWCEQR